MKCGVELVKVGFDVVVGASGVTAVAVFDPVGAGEEVPHLAVVGSLRQVAHQVDELVGVAVFPMPLNSLKLLGTHTA